MFHSLLPPSLSRHLCHELVKLTLFLSTFSPIFPFFSPFLSLLCGQYLLSSFSSSEIFSSYFPLSPLPQPMP